MERSVVGAESVTERSRGGLSGEFLNLAWAKLKLWFSGKGSKM